MTADERFYEVPESVLQELRQLRAEVINLRAENERLRAAECQQWRVDL